MTLYNNFWLKRGVGSFSGDYRAYLISGTGRFRNIRVPNFRDGGTVTEILTCLKSGITENLTCLKSGITSRRQG